jgi:hypothetical protein
MKRRKFLGANSCGAKQWNGKKIVERMQNAWNELKGRWMPLCCKLTLEEEQSLHPSKWHPADLPRRKEELPFLQLAPFLKGLEHGASTLHEKKQMEERWQSTCDRREAVVAVAERASELVVGCFPDCSFAKRQPRPQEPQRNEPCWTASSWS